MSKNPPSIIETNHWVKVAIRAWSARGPEDVILDARLTSPPFPSGLEQLRQALNTILQENLPGYRRISVAKWEGSIKQNADPKKTSTIRDVRDLCHEHR